MIPNSKRARRQLRNCSRLESVWCRRLDKTLATTSSGELQKRVSELLREKLSGYVYQGDALRAYRAIEVLERIADPPATKLLQALAGGSPDAFLTLTAKEAGTKAG